MNREYQKSILLFPDELRRVLAAVGEEAQGQIQEIRLRRCRPVVLFDGEKSRLLQKDGGLTDLYNGSAIIADERLFEECWLQFCSYSVHSHRNELMDGYVTAKTGDRIGVAASVVRSGEQTDAVRGVSGLNFRISREIPGAYSRIGSSTDLMNGLILAGPPSSGKTTLLRDAARILSDEHHRKVVIADERYEISAAEDGVPRRDIGWNSDVICGMKKERAIEQAVRTLSPQFIVCDEIAGEAELSRIRNAFFQGVHFVVSVHCGQPESLFENSVVRGLMESGAFGSVLLLSGAMHPGKLLRRIGREEFYAESHRNDFN